MPGFYYYLPGVTLGAIVDRHAINAGVLSRFGLLAALRDCQHAPDDAVITEAMSGPDRGAGVVIYPKPTAADDPTDYRYNAAQQAWRKVDADGEQPAYWIGWETARPPDVSALRRKVVLADYAWLDELGGQWWFACARSPRIGVSSLPVEYGFDSRGRVSRHPSPEFAELWKLSGEVLDHYRGIRPQDETWLVNAAIACFQVNHRIGFAALEQLRQLGRAVITRNTINGALEALIDRDIVQEWDAKKKPNEAAGDPESIAQGSTSA